MIKMILSYIICKDNTEATKIGKLLLEKRLAGCINIFPPISSMYHWKGKIESSKEVVLIAKTTKSKYMQLEKEVIKIHSYDTPCVLAIPVDHIADKYHKWLIDEIG